jgi:hypothetical protein
MNHKISFCNLKKKRDKKKTKKSFAKKANEAKIFLYTMIEEKFSFELCISYLIGA